jgi:hypothetical protein
MLALALMLEGYRGMAMHLRQRSVGNFSVNTACSAPITAAPKRSARTLEADIPVGPR